jgi:cell division protein FtsQ
VSATAAAALRRRISPRRAATRAAGQLTPHVRRRLVVLAVVGLVLSGLYQFWLRDSSLVAVDKVEVTGLTSTDAASVRLAIAREARTMTTLHVDHDALEGAVERFPVVRALEVSPDFPHGLRVHVIEYQPAAIAVSDSGRVPVAGDGTVLRGIKAKGSLPTIDVDGAVGGSSLTDATAEGAAAVAGFAPAVLRSRIENVQKRSDDGYVAELRDGPELLFGSAARLRAKWAAAARVLADLEARGATYVDLRIPGRPAVGGLAASTVTPVAPAGGSGLDTTGTTGTTTGTTTLPSTSASNEAPTDTTTAPEATTPSVTPTQPAVPQAQATPTEPLTAGTGGGATAAP